MLGSLPGMLPFCIPDSCDFTFSQPSSNVEWQLTGTDSDSDLCFAELFHLALTQLMAHYGSRVHHHRDALRFWTSAFDSLKRRIVTVRGKMHVLIQSLKNWIMIVGRKT